MTLTAQLNAIGDVFVSQVARSATTKNECRMLEQAVCLSAICRCRSDDWNIPSFLPNKRAWANWCFDV